MRRDGTVQLHLKLSLNAVGVMKRGSEERVAGTVLSPEWPRDDGHRGVGGRMTSMMMCGGKLWQVILFFKLIHLPALRSSIVDS